MQKAAEREPHQWQWQKGGRTTVRRYQPKENSGRRELSGVGGVLAKGEGPENPAKEPVGSREEGGKELLEAWYLLNVPRGWGPV